MFDNTTAYEDKQIAEATRSDNVLANELVKIIQRLDEELTKAQERISELDSFRNDPA